MKQLIVLVGLLAVALRSTKARADDASNREYQIKAAMIINFVSFTEWQKDAFPSDNAPLVIGVVGQNPFGSTLEQLCAGKNVAGHALVVRYFSSPQSIDRCQALFVPKSAESDVNQVMSKINGEQVLTIGESDNFPWAGGVIRFYLDDNKIHFEINPDGAEQAKVKISSKLMKLARIFKK